LNNLEKISETTLQNITKYAPEIEKVFLNFTPNISDIELAEMQKNFP